MCEDFRILEINPIFDLLNISYIKSSIMKRLIFAAATLGFIGFPHFVQAQSDKKTDKETEEVIIRKDGGKEMKLSVEINGDKISVNGKPLADFKDDHITINKRKMIIRDGENSMAFDFGPGEGGFNFGQDFMKNFKMESDEGSDAFLGVVTEKTDEGLKVKEVVPNSAAEKAGLQKEDIITKVNDKKLADAKELMNAISSLKPNDEVKISYLRAGKKNSTTAVLGEKKIKRSYAYAFRTPNDEGEGPLGDIELPRGNFDLQLDGDEAGTMMPHQKKLGLKIQDTEEGGNVKVIDVEENSAAATAGILKDDLITEIDGKKVANTDDAREQLHPTEGKSTYHIKAKRGNAEMTFDVKIPKKLKTADL